MASNISRLVVGLSGVSCGGKTTVTKLLKVAFPWASVLHQDAYFRPNDSEYHVYIPDLKHNNWELKTALDFPKMESDLQKILSNVPDQRNKMFRREIGDEVNFENDEFVMKNKLGAEQVEHLLQFANIQLVFLEGHIIFHHEPFYNMCDLRYFFTLDENECKERRRLRVYDPPNPPGFFDQCVWPAYLERFSAVQKLPGINFVDAKRIPLKNIYHFIFVDIVSQLKLLSEQKSTEFVS